MIVGKNSAKLGFTWFGKIIVKVTVAALAISVGGFGVAVGCISLALSAYEVIKEYKDLSE